MNDVWTEGQRKLVYCLLALVVLCVAAAALHPTYAEFRDGIVVWLGAALTAHVAAEKIGARAATPGAKP